MCTGDFMLKINNLELRFGTRTLFKDVNLELKDNNCYGIIGANGAGKSTFLKIISGEIDSTKGEVVIGKGERISTLRQNHNEFDEYNVLETVLMGDDILYSIMKEKEDIYSKPDFSMEDGIKAGELEAAFEQRNGWQAESDAATLLAGLGLGNEYLDKKMGELKDKEKVKVLLARALFGNPDVLLLDEPTNGLDNKSIHWLEEFLINFSNTVLVVSHDRHFLNQVCTHMIDIDYEKITLFVGNYDFWVKSSELIQKQMLDSNKRKEEKIKELEDFIRRFSANASKSKQATSRKKSLEKIVLDEIKPSSRKYPFIQFDFEKSVGKEVISLEKVCYKDLLKNINITVRPDDKIAILGENELAKTALLNILAGSLNPDSGDRKVGSNIKISYFEKNHDSYFKEDIDLTEWLKKYSLNKEESFVRGFLGRMLFSKDEVFKKVNVLSGGEKVRIMLSKMMLEHGNVLIFDEPTNHLDIESITSLNKAIEKFKGCVVISTFDQEIIDTVCNRLIYIKKDGTIKDKQMTLEEFYLKFGDEL